MIKFFVKKKKKTLTNPSFYGFFEICPYKLGIQVIVAFQRGLIGIFLVYHMKRENEESAWHVHYSILLTSIMLSLWYSVQRFKKVLDLNHIRNSLILKKKYFICIQLL